jgi:hypothetical protein
MSENLSNSSSSENLVSPPARAPRPSPAPSSPRRDPAAAPPEQQTGPITADNMKTGKKVNVSKPLTFKKTDKKKD